MKKKILSGFLTLVAMMTISTGSVFAQDLIKSTPSRADDVTAGEDVTQGKKTEYAEPESISDTTYESDKVVYIYQSSKNTYHGRNDYTGYLFRRMCSRHQW